MKKKTFKSVSKFIHNPAQMWVPITDHDETLEQHLRGIREASSGKCNFKLFPFDLFILKMHFGLLDYKTWMWFA